MVPGKSLVNGHSASTCTDKGGKGGGLVIKFTKILCETLLNCFVRAGKGNRMSEESSNRASQVMLCFQLMILHSTEQAE